jgi:ABC-type glycerol-3-phosphate transport system substrate-binding protein
MKKIIFCVMTFLLIATIVPLVLIAAKDEPAKDKEAPPEKITLRYVSNMWREGAIAAQERQLEAFKKAHPNIDIEPTIYIPWADYRTWLLRAVASDTLPDVVQHGVEFLDEFAQYGAFLALEDFITDDHYDRVIDAAWETAKVEGTIYALPHMLWIEPAFMYRKDIFRNEGIEPAPIGDPWSMEEALAVAKKLTADLDGDGIVDRWGWVERGRVGWIFLKHFGWHIRTWGGDIITKTPDGKYKSGIKLPETRQAIKFFVELHTKNKVAPEAAIGYGFSDWRSGFISDQIAMGTMGTWLGGILIPQNPDVEWGIMDLPYANQSITQVATFSMSISSQTKHQEAAWELANWLTTNTVEDRVEICDIQGGMIVLRDILETSDYQNNPNREVLKPYMKGFLSGEIKNVKTWARHPSPQYADVMISVVAPTVHNIILGEMTFDEGIDHMDKEINKKLQYRE